MRISPVHSFRRFVIMLLMISVPLAASWLLTTGFAAAQIAGAQETHKTAWLQQVGLIDTNPQEVVLIAQMPYLFTAEDYELRVYDLSQPQTPVRAATLDLSDHLTRAIQMIYADVQDNTAYIAARDSGVIAVDITTPTQPSFISHQSLPAWQDIQAVLAAGNHLYLLDSEEESSWMGSHLTVRAIDIAGSWQELDALALPGGASFFGASAFLQNEMLFVMSFVSETPYDGNSVLTAVDISQPADLKQIFQFSAATFSSVALRADGIAFLGHDYDGWCVTRESDQCSQYLRTVRVGGAAPIVIASHNALKTGETEYGRMAMAGDYLLALIDTPISQGVNSDTMRRPERDQQTPVLLRVFDTLSPENPAATDTLDVHRQSSALIVDGDFIFITGNLETTILRLMRQEVSVTIPVSGGALLSPADHVSYLFPNNTFTTPVSVTHTVRTLGLSHQITENLFSQFVFQLGLVNSQANPIGEAERPFTFTLAYGDEEWSKRVTSSTAIYEQVAGQWQLLPTQVDLQAQTLAATLTHGGLYVVAVEHELVYLPAALRCAYINVCL